MKKNIPAIIALLSLAIATGGFSFGVRTANQNSRLRAEAQALRDQLNAGSVLPERDPANEDTAVTALRQGDHSETNDVALLQEQLAARSAELDILRAELARRQEQAPRESFQDRMARMKEEDPERYAEMIKRRTERSEQMRYDHASRLAIFMDMDTSSMTPEELANHNLLLEKLTTVWEKTDEYDPTQPPDRETRYAIFSALRDVNDLMDQERSVMLRQLGTEVGLSAREAEDFAAYAESIISATTLRPPRGGRGPYSSN